MVVRHAKMFSLIMACAFLGCDANPTPNEANNKPDRQAEYAAVFATVERSISIDRVEYFQNYDDGDCEVLVMPSKKVDGEKSGRLEISFKNENPTNIGGGDSVIKIQGDAIILFENETKNYGFRKKVGFVFTNRNPELTKSAIHESMVTFSGGEFPSPTDEFTHELESVTIDTIEYKGNTISKSGDRFYD